MSMEQDHFDAIESAALNAWPAPRQMLYDGWLLRMTGGNSKRINSVNIRYPSSLPLAEKIAFCSEIYAQHDLPLIFRLPDPLATEDLHQALDQAGLHEYDPTYVYGREIAVGDAEQHDVTARPLAIEDWLEARSRITQTPVIRLVDYTKVLGIIVPEKALLGLYLNGEPVACGMGVVEGHLLGYFSIYTHPSHRRRGYGRAMMAALAQWGVGRGATYGYLQVEGDNAPALAMYAAMGFENIYRYKYYK